MPVLGEFPFYTRCNVWNVLETAAAAVEAVEAAGVFEHHLENVLPGVGGEKLLRHGPKADRGSRLHPRALPLQHRAPHHHRDVPAGI